MKSLFLIALLAAAVNADDLTPHRKDTPETKDLESRVAAYLKLRKEAVANVPKLKDKAEPEEIQAHKTAELHAIQAARAGARQGDLLSPAVQQYIKDIIRSEAKGKSGKPARDSAAAGNPVKEGPTSPVPLKVNSPYPDKAPLSTVPPTLLLRLPTLPKELDFRFVGHDLILHDVQAAMIVDFVPNALP